MVLGLSGPVLPENTVNDCLNQLTALVSAVDGLDVVYGYRTKRTELRAQAIVTSVSALLGDTPDGLSAAYDYLIDIQVRIDGDYEAAEQDVNAICDGIWRAIWGPNGAYWSNCYPYAADQKPASTQELVNWRRGLLYVRVIPN